MAGGYDDKDAYERFKKRESKKEAEKNLGPKIMGIPFDSKTDQKEKPKHVDLRKSFSLGDLIRFSQYPEESDAVVATVIGYGKAYSILIGWRMGEKIPHVGHYSPWELPIEPNVYVNDWRMFARMMWVSLPNNIGITIDPRQPSQTEMDEALQFLNDIRLLHNSPNEMEKYNHILGLKKSVMAEFIVKSEKIAAVSATKENKPNEQVKNG